MFLTSAITEDQMTLDISARFQLDLMHHLAARNRVPACTPLPISPYVAMSLLQKAVRRGQLPLALQAAATLHHSAPDRLWRRIGGVAFEDIGIADLPALKLVSAALTGKRFRVNLGGEWAVASAAVEIMVRARKSRASDDLFMTLEALPSLAADRMRMVKMPDAQLQRIVGHDPSLHRRALALLFLIGTNKPGGSLPARKGNTDRAFDLLTDMGVAPSTLEICRIGYRKICEPLPPLVALLSLANGLRSGVVDDALPPELMIGGVPGWALDMFTREGKQALTRLLVARTGVAEFASAILPPSNRVRFLGQVLFRVEGGQLIQRVGGDLCDRLHSQLMFDTLGVDPGLAVKALDLMRADIPVLNRIRATILKGQRHEA